MKRNKRILLVDDSTTARSFIRSAIEGQGYEITEAGNGIEALKMIDAAIPDAMVLDLLMPEMDGFEVLEKLQEKKISFPIIVLTADIQEEVKEEVIELGASMLLNKPQVKEHLLDNIKQVLT